MAMTSLQPLAVLFVLSSGAAPCPGHFSVSSEVGACGAFCFSQAKEMQGICPLVPPMARAGLNR